MKTAMRTKVQEDKQIIREKEIKLSERNKRADRLVEYWSKIPNLGEGIIDIYDNNPNKARGLAIVMENQRNYLKTLTETTISSAFSTTPENVMRVIRLGYPNSIIGDVFHLWDMETARDSIYYLKPQYLNAKRGSTANTTTHESAAFRYETEYEEESLGTGDGSTTAFTGAVAGAVANPPLRPWYVKILNNEEIVAIDDGSGNLSGSTLDSTGTNEIDYTTGAVTVTFTTAPTSGNAIKILYAFDSEDSDQYTDLGEITLTLTDYQFRAHPWPVKISWSKMTELLLGTTLDIDAEEALIKGAADELKKSIDFFAIKQGYRYAKSNTLVTFNADFASAGSDSETEHAQSITRKIEDAGDIIYAALQRGGVSQMVAGPTAANYLRLHKRFTPTGAQPAIGGHKIGELDGKGIYKVPSSIVPTDEVLCVWKNPSESGDVSISFGMLIPLYSTPRLEYAERNIEQGLAMVGDWRALNTNYLVRLKLSNLS